MSFKYPYGLTHANSVLGRLLIYSTCSFVFQNKDGTYIDVQECHIVVFCSVTGSYKTIPYMVKQV